MILFVNRIVYVAGGPMDIQKILPLRQFCRNSHIPERALRHAIFNAKKAGIVESGAVVRVSGRWYVDPDAFAEWTVATTQRWLEAQPEPVN